MLTVEMARPIPNALDIPYVTQPEAHSLLKTELERFLTLIETLEAEDWAKPTPCTAWTVRDILAHQAAGYTSGSGYTQMIVQYARLPQRGRLFEDVINDRQLFERRSRTPEELIAELRRSGPLAAQKWAYQFRLARLLGIPHPVPGWLSLRHLMWVIHSRDTWMHRLDISRATGRPFLQTADHDGRIASLVMLDVARLLSKKLTSQAVVFNLSGPSGGLWKVGSGEAVAEVHMDALDFNIFASGRFTFGEAVSRAIIYGDRPAAENALKSILILF